MGYEDAVTWIWPATRLAPRNGESKCAWSGTFRRLGCQTTLPKPRSRCFRRLYCKTTLKHELALDSPLSCRQPDGLSAPNRLSVLRRTLCSALPQGRL